jgi:hypothetical protein
MSMDVARRQMTREAIQVGGIGHVGGCLKATHDTRESGSDGARALQMGGIGHVDNCREAPYESQKVAQTERGLPEGNSDGRHRACRWLSRGAIRHARKRLRRSEGCRRVIQMGGIMA